jgi:hypothetical protein
MRKSHRKRQPLWASSRKEVRWIWSLLPLCVVDCDAEWSTCVHCYDASLSGFGVVASRWPLEQVTRHGRLRERARFRGLLSKTSGDGDDDNLLSVSGRCRGDAFLECLGLTAGFEEISDAALNDNSWTVVASQPWKQPPSHITLMEAKTRTFNVRHIARTAYNHGLKHLLCGDNMSTICMGTKGRPSDYDMLVEARKVCAISLAANLTIVDRWIPTRCIRCSFQKVCRRYARFVRAKTKAGSPLRTSVLERHTASGGESHTWYVY